MNAVRWLRVSPGRPLRPTSRVPEGSRQHVRRALGWPVWLALWAVAGDTGMVQQRAFAGPIATAHALIHDLWHGSFALDIVATTLRVGSGVLLGLLVGVPLGFVAGSRRARRERMEPALDFARAVPPVLIFSLLLFALGYGEASRVLAVAYVAVLAVAFHVSTATYNLDRERLRALRALGAGRLALARYLYVYELLPAGLASVRHAVCSGLIVSVVTEMLVGAAHGLGTRALDAQISYDAPRLYAVILVTGALGQFAARALLKLERQLCSWHTS